jgi:hypothetical protein
VQELRRSTRERRANTRYSTNEFVFLVDSGEPECFEEAMVSEHKNKWLEVMQDEMKSLQKKTRSNWWNCQETRMCSRINGCIG